MSIIAGVYLDGGVRLITANEFTIRPDVGMKNTTTILLRDCNIQIDKKHLIKILRNFDKDEIEEVLKEI